jgi:hypothetical protein
MELNRRHVDLNIYPDTCYGSVDNKGNVTFLTGLGYTCQHNQKEFVN